MFAIGRVPYFTPYIAPPPPDSGADPFRQALVSDDCDDHIDNLRDFLQDGSHFSQFTLSNMQASLLLLFFRISCNGDAEYFDLLMQVVGRYGIALSELQIGSHEGIVSNDLLEADNVVEALEGQINCYLEGKGLPNQSREEEWVMLVMLCQKVCQQRSSREFLVSLKKELEKSCWVKEAVDVLYSYAENSLTPSMGDLEDKMAKVELSEMTLRGFSEDQDLAAYMPHLLAVLQGKKSEKFHQLPSEKQREIYASVIKALNSGVQGASSAAIFMVPYLATRDNWQKVMEELLPIQKLSLQAPMPSFAEALYFWKVSKAPGTESERASRVAGCITYFADCSLAWYRGKRLSKDDEVVYLQKKRYELLGLLLDISMTPYFEMTVLFYLDPSPQLESVNPEALEWTEKLRGDERDLFVQIVNHLDFPDERREKVCLHYTRSDAPREFIAFAIRLIPSLSEENLIELLERVRADYADLFGEFMKYLKLPMTSDETREKLFKTYVRKPNSKDLLLALQMRNNLSIAEVSQVQAALDTLLPDGSEAEEVHRTSLRTLFRITWKCDKRYPIKSAHDLEAVKLVQSLMKTIAKCGLASEFTEESCQTKIVSTLKKSRGEPARLSSPKSLKDMHLRNRTPKPTSPPPYGDEEGGD